MTVSSAATAQNPTNGVNPGPQRARRVDPQSAAHTMSGIALTIVRSVHARGAIEATGVDLSDAGQRRAALEDGRRSHDEQVKQLTEPTAAELAQQAEREAAPGSRAHQRDTTRRIAREDAQRRNAEFRRAVKRAQDQRQAPQSQPREASRPAAGNPAETRQEATSRAFDVQSASRVERSEQPVAQTAQQSASGTQSTPAASTAQSAFAGVSIVAPPQALRASLTVSELKVTSVQSVQAPSSSSLSAAKASNVQTAQAAKATPPMFGAGSRSQQSSASAHAKSATAKAHNQAQESTAERNIDRIIKLVRDARGNEKSTTVMRLDPPELGRLRLRMEMQHNALTLHVETETDLARRMLSDELETLRRGLTAAGVKLEQVDIRPATPASHAPEQDAPGDQTDRQDAGSDSQEANPEDATERDGREDAAPASAAKERVAASRAEADAAAGDTPAETDGPAKDSLVNVIA